MSSISSGRCPGPHGHRPPPSPWKLTLWFGSVTVNESSIMLYLSLRIHSPSPCVPASSLLQMQIRGSQSSYAARVRVCCLHMPLPDPLPVFTTDSFNTDLSQTRTGKNAWLWISHCSKWASWRDWAWGGSHSEAQQERFTPSHSNSDVSVQKRMPSRKHIYLCFILCFTLE